jgi:hypothetical protein
LPGFIQGEGVGRNWICRCHAGGGQLGTEAWSESKFACGDETFNIQYSTSNFQDMHRQVLHWALNVEC